MPTKKKKLPLKKKEKIVYSLINKILNRRKKKLRKKKVSSFPILNLKSFSNEKDYFYSIQISWLLLLLYSTIPSTKCLQSRRISTKNGVPTHENELELYFPNPQTISRGPNHKYTILNEVLNLYLSCSSC